MDTAGGLSGLVRGFRLALTVEGLRSSTISHYVRDAERLAHHLEGLDATRLIRSESPGSRVLILTMHRTDEYFFSALEAGASGYVLKEAASNDLVNAIESIHQGGMFLYPSPATRLVEDYLRRVGRKRSPATTPSRPESGRSSS